jgi:hypothetical protein
MTETMRAFVIRKVGETGLQRSPSRSPALRRRLSADRGRTLGHESVGVIHKLRPVVTHSTTSRRPFDLMTSKEDGIIKPLIKFS